MWNASHDQSLNRAVFSSSSIFRGWSKWWIFLTRDERYCWYHNTIRLASEVSDYITGVVRIDFWWDGVDLMIFCEQDATSEWFDFLSSLRSVIPPACVHRWQRPWTLAWMTWSLRCRLGQIQTSFTTVILELGHQCATAPSKMHIFSRNGHIFVLICTSHSVAKCQCSVWALDVAWWSSHGALCCKYCKVLWIMLHVSRHVLDQMWTLNAHPFFWLYSGNLYSSLVSQVDAIDH